MYAKSCGFFFITVNIHIYVCGVGREESDGIEERVKEGRGRMSGRDV